jgi:hypothetical protein
MITPIYRIYNKKNKRYEESLFALWNWTIRDYRWDEEYILDDYIIERCTWMQDIKWVRMYENDIVTFWLDYKDIKYTLIYEWMQWKISDWANLKFVTDWKDLEVVWNIHS